MLELMTAMPEVPGGAARSWSSMEAAQPEEGGDVRDLEMCRGDFRPGMAQATEKRAAAKRIRLYGCGPSRVPLPVRQP